MATNREITWQKVRWLLAGVTCLVPLFALPALMRSAYSRDGIGDHVILEKVLEGGFLFLAIGVIFASLAFLFSKKSRLRGIRLMLFGVVLGVSSFIGGQLAHEARNEAIERFAKEAEPLIAAIKAYERQHGTAPERLEQLVPGFLAAIPATGLPAAPKWTYSQERSADGSVEWRLTVVEGIGLGEILYVPEPGCGEWGVKVTGGTWCYWPW
ncbi:MAG: hypothetical protein MUE49_13520 [Rhodospirillales bacterium]|jgi:hypothetical protein|nr:hypothetical protein [Rhodospirillales bacterium]